ncbi:MAG: cyclase family protein [Candidatus Altiarchaeota archaeon]|nr:cyclase family protein [Candidatus Altiarchaeota archaeon]
MEFFDISMEVSEDMVVYEGDPGVRLRKVKDISDDGVALSEITLCLHSGTHVDAPAHYFEDGRSIDLIPPIVGKAVVFDLSHVKDSITSLDLMRLEIVEGDIVLFKTQNSTLGGDDFSREFVYLGDDGADFLVDRGVKAVGIDYLSIEAFDSKEHYVHKKLLSNNIAIIEGLVLGKIQPGSYTLFCLPLKVRGGEAAPARCILSKHV